MARRRVAAPSEAELRQFEADYDGEAGGGARAARDALSPITRVAAEAAALSNPEPAEAREGRARDAADAARMREAEAAGRVMRDLPVDQIDADAMVRDRMILDQDEMDELRRSILEHGLRLPIEVFQREDGTYGLISGYRRLRAVRSIRGELGLPGHDTIRAVVREPEALGGAVVAMVEENEVRAQLSPYERGRIAVIAAQDGAFPNVEAAVAGLFGSASKAKRSKIRSFAAIHEDLGDLLEHADQMGERDGLRLAAMLRQGGEAALRRALEDGPAATFAEEWAMIEPALRAHERALAEGRRAPPEGGERDATARRGGRPRREAAAEVEVLDSGIRLERRRVAGGWSLTMTGRGVDEAIMDGVMQQVRHLLGKP